MLCIVFLSKNINFNSKQPKQKHCFVVMGFGEKTDYITGRKLYLNQSYHLLIKPVVEAIGYLCLRADEIKHSGITDEVMYRELFEAKALPYEEWMLKSLNSQVKKLDKLLQKQGHLMNPP